MTALMQTGPGLALPNDLEQLPPISSSPQTLTMKTLKVLTICSSSRSNWQSRRGDRAERRSKKVIKREVSPIQVPPTSSQEIIDLT
ncbi:hypothetical protein BC628DRAFT_179794 [Trametes gibbosa]|nr:hypothetical protein BC628DRAFT_179794 [Trametes gibbosa]